ncbi:MAG: fatty acyl-AMP ligase [Elainellaceae cyanobacterium]
MHSVLHTFSTLIDIIEQRSRDQPYQTALSFVRDGTIEVATLTYAELHQRARAIAAYLQHYQSFGQRALLVYPAGLDFVAAFLGCLYAGAIAVPVCPPRRNQTLQKLQLIADDCQATLLLTTDAVLRQTLMGQSSEFDGLSSLHTIATDRLEGDCAADWQKPPITPEHLAFLQYTSGSTGHPKGVMVSHRNLLHNSALIYRQFGHTPQSQGVIWLPNYHDMGLIGGIVQPLYGGFPCVLMEPVDFLQQPFRWLQAISHYQATTSGGPNFAYDLCVRRVTSEQRTQLNLSSWTVAFNGAEPIQADVLDRFVDAFAPCGFRREAFYPCYGMAETTLLVTGGGVSQPPILCSVEKQALEQNQVVFGDNKLIEDTRRLVGCGQSAPDLTVRIVDPDRLTPYPANQVGEIWVAGPSVAQGYWNNPEQTQQTFQAHIAHTEVGPFLRTGDLGFLREDGELFVTGRLKDVIIIRGANHYPQDIERTVEQSHPALRSGCGVAFAVNVAGQEQLVVVQEVERSYLRKLPMSEVLGCVRQALAQEHGLQAHAIVLIKTATIPKTSSGKVQRRLCREQYLDGTLDVLTETPLQSPYEPIQNSQSA